LVNAPNCKPAFERGQSHHRHDQQDDGGLEIAGAQTHQGLLVQPDASTMPTPNKAPPTKEDNHSHLLAP